jgi:hypothetical protein
MKNSKGAEENWKEEKGETGDRKLEIKKLRYNMWKSAKNNYKNVRGVFI